MAPPCLHPDLTIRNLVNSESACLRKGGSKLSGSALSKHDDSELTKLRIVKSGCEHGGAIYYFR